MKRMVAILSILSIGLWACTGAKVEKQGEGQPLAAPVKGTPNQCPEITDVSLSDSTVRGGEQVRIGVTAEDPDNDHLFYFWSALQGELTGRASQVVWTAPACSEVGTMTATYNLTVDVSDGKCTINQSMAIAVNCGLESPGQKPDAMILFPAGGTGLDNIAKAQLDTLAALFKQFPDQTIVLEGHTDATGNEEANKQIGLKRAESVKQYLVKRHSIDPNRITTASYGSSKPADTNDTEAGRAKNRRVEIYRKF
jgi:outer membrane protein OmpA-like peptidoglycan-associated protein